MCEFLLSVKSEHLFVHDAATGRMLHHIVGHNGQITSAAFSPDGKWLATAGADQTVRIWDLETGKEKRNFRGHAQTVNCVAFHPNGRRSRRPELTVPCECGIGPKTHEALA